ncbi:MAG: DNA methyltransferase [Chloroflexota bacterium]|nr:DNA methyltransferase [Chloroflexota bacterium]
MDQKALKARESQLTAPNFADKTVWIGDNLDVLRGLNSDTVDLIYLDPPFNSNRDYSAPIGSRAAGAAFKDTWTLSDLDKAWLGLVADEHPSVYSVVDASGAAHGKSMQSYLCMMAVRLLELRRVLKDHGSIYLHCDPNAGAYLKLLMDAIFGAANFQNEVVWRRTSGRSDAKRFGRVHDVLLFYAGPDAAWNRPYLPHDRAYIDRAYRNEDELGRWQPDQLTASGRRDGESGRPWRGINPSGVGRHWATPVKGGMARFIVEKGLIPGWPGDFPEVHARLNALDEAGLIYWPSKPGGMPRLKRYLESTSGKAVDDIFVDIGKLEASAKEKLGYPTQKPLALLERIILASSNPGDVLLDPFCGCATACVAAEKLGRKWVGIDISAKAVELVHERLREPPPLGIGALFHNRLVTTRTDHPQRTDLIAPINYKKSKHVLFGNQEGHCNGCQSDFPYRLFEIDHVVPRTRGGSDHVENLQLLCPHCNRIKGDRSQAYLVSRLMELGVLQGGRASIHAHPV